MNDDEDPLDANQEPRKLARNTDPSTSKRAALSSSQFSGTHHKIIYDALLSRKDGTVYEIAEVAGMDPAPVFRRVNELKKAGHIFLTGTERPGPAGRMCRVWTVDQDDEGDAASIAALAPEPAPVETQCELFVE